MNVRKNTINAIRILSAEAIDKAKSGHPGLPLGCAPIAYTLFQNFLQFNPADLKWDNRDRFILSAGHGSMLYYSLLHPAALHGRRENAGVEDKAVPVAQQLVAEVTVTGSC